MSAAAETERAAGDEGVAAYRFLLALLAYAVPFIFILLPLILFLIQSFYYVEDGAIIHEFTLRNYERFFTGRGFVPVFFNTILLCFGVALITVVFGYPIAYLLASLRGRRKYVMMVIFVVPLMMSYIIKIYAIRAILGGNGFLNRILLHLGIIDQPLTFLIFNLNAVLVTLSIILLPFAVLPIFIALERIPRSVVDASADLGASAFQSFRDVVWPLSIQGTVVGGTFVFVLALGDFITPQMVGGMSGFTFGRIIYSQFGFAFNWPFGAALSVILLIVVLVAIVGMGLITRRRYQI
ncbi:MAG: ABC transporter permease [Bauldia sp.]|nr:ABC transporter permease [Bauldia sp.]